jgi:putative ABC transport system permease protein
LVVVAVAFAVAGVAALVPALRAARMSTVTALADSARTPRRRPLLVAVSTRLPVTLLISIRVMARRLRRTLLSVFSVFVTVSGLVAVIAAHEHLNDTRFAGTAGLVNPRIQSADQVLLMLSLMLVALAAVNAVFITRAIVVDARHSSALMRALGATPRQVTVGLAAAQTLPAALGALLGIPGGIELYDAVRHGTNAASFPSLMPVITVVLGSMLAVALLTALPARYGIRKPVAGILQSELA